LLDEKESDEPPIEKSDGWESDDNLKEPVYESYDPENEDGDKE
jgi:hypothetical protein